MSKIELFHIRPDGLDYLTAPVRTTIAENNGWQLDLLKDGRYLVSRETMRVGVFLESSEANGYFIRQSHIERSHFGPLVAEEVIRPVLYQTLRVLDQTMEEVMEELFDNGGYWRSTDRLSSLATF